ncbi:MAG: DUF1887 family protein [Ktedonobacteraceae bacterium]|nr:DUF1887 family protein [Ktedonobacteraceae bacterium]
MEKKKALLIVAGGRAIPNVLSLLYLRPQVVRVILSKEGWDHKQAFVDIARSIPDCQIDIIADIDAYDFNICLEACQNACEPYPDDEWEWTFDITSAPKITGIAAYEVAKQKGVSCWHADAQRERHVSLVKPVEIDTARFFHLTLDDYMKAQHRIWAIPQGPVPDYRQIVTKWADITKELVASPDTIELLTLLHDKKPGDTVPLPAHLIYSPLLQSIANKGLLEIDRLRYGVITGEFTSKQAAKFLGTGDWLEFYVWNEAVSTKLDDDSNFTDEFHCQWGCSIFDGPVEKELDLALMYKAQLILAECKAEQNPYLAKRGHLHKLQAKANVLEVLMFANFLSQIKELLETVSSLFVNRQNNIKL